MVMHNDNCPAFAHDVCPPPTDPRRRLPWSPNDAGQREVRDGRDRLDARDNRDTITLAPIAPVADGEVVAGVGSAGNGNGNGAGADDGGEVDPLLTLRPIPPTEEMDGFVPEVTVLTLMRELINEVKVMQQYIIEAPLPPLSGAEVKVVAVEVVTAGTPVPAPDLIIPPGVLVIIRQRHHGSDRTGYVSFDGESNTANVLGRSELKNNDSFTKRLSSLQDIYLDASADNTFFEFIFEQSRRPELDN